VGAGPLALLGLIGALHDEGWPTGVGPAKV
jgi:hypothetical protein